MPAKPLTKEIYIVAAKRTPFGTFGGKLKDISAIDLGVVAAKAALAEGNVDPSAVDHVVVGNVAQTSADAIYMARHIGLKSGVPIESPALTIIPELQARGAHVVAFDNFLRALRERTGEKLRFDFKHGARYDLGDDLPALFATYHPSPRNTNTGRLTVSMLDAVFTDVSTFLDQS